MGLSADKLGSFFTKLIQKGDPQAAMAAGKGPVTTEWAASHGYKQFRSPDIPLTRESLKLVGEAASIYGIYAKHKETKKRIKTVKKETRKKKTEAELRRRRSRLLRRPSRERGIL